MVRHCFFMVLCCFSFSAFAVNSIIPFSMVNGLIIIDAGYNKSEGKFIFDTGSDGLFIDKQNAELQASTQSYQTVAGNVNVESITLKQFSFGNIKKRNVPAYTTNLTHLESFLQMDLAGIMGTAIFNPHSVYIDFTDSTIQIYDSYVDFDTNGLLNTTSFDWENGVPVVQVSIGNSMYSFILDSGASIHLIDNVVIESHHSIITSELKNVALKTLNPNDPQTQSKKFLLSELKISNFGYQNISCLNANLSLLQEGFSKKISGILSLSEIAGKGVFIDFENKQIHF